MHTRTDIITQVCIDGIVNILNQTGVIGSRFLKEDEDILDEIINTTEDQTSTIKKYLTPEAFQLLATKGFIILFLLHHTIIDHD